MNDRDAVIVSGARTPIGRFLGALAPLKAPELGAVAIREALARAGVKGDEPDEVLFGCVAQAAVGQAPARQAAIKGGVSPSVPATTVNKVCGSGLKAVMLAAQAVRAGDADIVVAGGMESMSNVPHYLLTGRTGVKLGDQKLVDGVVYDGLWCAFNNQHMGNLAEYTAAKSGITRQMQDEFALRSHQRAVAAQKACHFKKETVAVPIPQRKGEPVLVGEDESPRADASLEALGKLPPAFQKDNGTVTAGNAPGLNDGAAALVVMSAAAAARRGVKPLARVTAYANGAMEPRDLFYAPVVAVEKVLRQLGKKIGDFDLIEVNEAFAAQALADGKELGWDWERVNVHGGAVALGHPIGASGARVLVTLLSALEQRGGKTGLATLCLGGGGAVALAVERLP